MRKIGQKGSGTLAMVLLIAIIGLLLMSGLQRQLDAAAQAGNDERLYLRAFNQALSSLNWGLGQHWNPMAEKWQCRQLPDEQLAVCLRGTSDGLQGLLRGDGTFPTTDRAAADRPMRLYQRVSLAALSSGLVAIQPVRNGWLDFCPDNDAARCDATE